jgi:hypothetical protein
MSLLRKCNLCGKSEDYSRLILDNDGKVKDVKKPCVFSSGPLTFLCENYQGEKYRVSLHFDIINEEDNKNVRKLDNLSRNELIKGIHNNPVVIKEPNPHVCNSCKMESLTKAMKNKDIKIVSNPMDNKKGLTISIHGNYQDLLDRLQSDDDLWDDEFDDEFDDEGI